MTCTCHSYNWGTGMTPEKMMKDPRTGSDICVDACIADTIAHLWANKVETKGSCCGHNRQPPSIVIHDQATIEDRRRIWSLIEEAGDNRPFDLVSWTPVHYRPVKNWFGRIECELTITEFSNRNPNRGG